VLALNLANFLRAVALPKEVEHWSMATLRELLIKIGAKIVRHGPPITFSDGRPHGVARVVPSNPVRHRGPTTNDGVT
jgi:hypothetical protein